MINLSDTTFDNNSVDTVNLEAYGIIKSLDTGVVEETARIAVDPLSLQTIDGVTIFQQYWAHTNDGTEIDNILVIKSVPAPSPLTILFIGLCHLVYKRYRTE